jgi:hypothetical protein
MAAQSLNRVTGELTWNDQVVGPTHTGEQVTQYFSGVYSLSSIVLAPLLTDRREAKLHYPSRLDQQAVYVGLEGPKGTRPSHARRFRGCKNCRVCYRRIRVQADREEFGANH